MNILQTLGIGCKKLIRQGERIPAVVTGVKTCWWLKINTKPVRAHMWDGALFPHLIRCRYTAGGRDYEGQQIISPCAACPKVGDAITLCCRPGQPERFAILTDRD